jgi:tRNA dimethylallyltransferase
MAHRLDAEIVSVDSMQVYRGMDIGTAKPSRHARESTEHHLIDIADPHEDFSVERFRGAGREALAAIARRGRAAIIGGGSGLHFRALVDPMNFAPTDENLRADLEAMDPADLVSERLGADPGAAALIDLQNPRRVVRAVEVLRLTGKKPTDRERTAEARALREYRSEIPCAAVAIDPGSELETRIEDRFAGMLRSGLLEEVTRLEPVLGRTARQAVGYKEMLRVIRGTVSIDEARADAIAATRALAKRQRTWFRRDPRLRWLQWHHGADDRIEQAWTALTEEPVWSS